MLCFLVISLAGLAQLAYNWPPINLICQNLFVLIILYKWLFVLRK